MVEIPAGSVIITPTEFYKEMQGIDSKVDDIRADLKAVLPMVPDHESRIRTLERDLKVVLPMAPDHEGRIRMLERRMWVMAGAATVLGGSLGVAARAILGA